MKRWRKVIWTFLLTVIAFFAFCVWSVKTRSGLVFEKDQYWKQMLDYSPFVTKNIGPDGQYMKASQILESGTLRGLEKQRVESATPFGDVTETWRGPCYVEIQLNDERKVIWGKKLTKVEHAIMHSVHVTIE